MDHWEHGDGDGKKLPIGDWAGEFVDKLPGEIQQALRDARGSVCGSIEDPAWRKRLADKFGSRWKLPRLRVCPDGDSTVDPTQGGSKPGTGRRRRRKPSTRTRRGGLSGGRTTGSNPGNEPAKVVELHGGLPDYTYVKAGDVESGMVAAWQRVHPDFPRGNGRRLLRWGNLRFQNHVR